MRVWNRSSIGAWELDPRRVVSFTAIHMACFGTFWVGASVTALTVCVALYLVRMFAITGFYHRYFSHRSFKTSRTAQLLFGLLGASAMQCGPVWWAAHHREHHVHSDTALDVHSPARHGFWRSHVGWFLTREHFAADYRCVKDWIRYPELMWLEKFDVLVPSLLASALFSIGMVLKHHYPRLHTDGWQMLVWGFFISTVAVYHATYTINSLSHVFGTQRYDTEDSSRNNLWLALLTLGEGWHNNHHHYPRAARQGFYWWELDLTWYLLRLLACVGVIWDLRPVPPRVRDGDDRSLS